MSQETLADKIAKKSFLSPQIQKHWAVHMQAFGPILGPAFAEDYQTRIHLIAALNHISRRELTEGFEKLQSITDRCVTDADNAACLFFLGVLCEMEGNVDQAMVCYQHANEYSHGFYLPFLKLAKYYLGIHMYAEAEQAYLDGIACLNPASNAQHQSILASAYANLASCLIMMHRYDEGERALADSRRLAASVPGRPAVEAALYAIRGDEQRLADCLAQLQAQSPALYAGVKASTDKILAGTNPLFFAQPISQAALDDFWAWFAGYADELDRQLQREEYEEGLAPVAEKLLEAFPFMEEPPYVALGQNETGWVLELKDLYATGIADAYARLMRSRPAAVPEYWQFAVLH